MFRNLPAESLKEEPNADFNCKCKVRGQTRSDSCCVLANVVVILGATAQIHLHKTVTRFTVRFPLSCKHPFRCVLAKGSALGQMRSQKQILSLGLRKENTIKAQRKACYCEQINDSSLKLVKFERQKIAYFLACFPTSWPLYCFAFFRLQVRKADRA